MKVEVSRSTTVGAPAETVWRLLSRIERWPDWNPAVRRAALDGPLADGTVFRWKAGQWTIRSVIRQVKKGRLISWTGRTMGIRAEHVWWIEPSDGACVVGTGESWDGLLVRLLPGLMRRQLDKALDASLTALKRASEAES